MKKATPFFCILFSIALIQFALALPPQPSYELHLKYSYGNISIQSLTVKPFFSEAKEPEGSYYAEIYGKNNVLLNRTFFSIPLLIFTDDFDETGAVSGSIVELNETEVTVHLPYSADAQTIHIKDKNLQTKLVIDVGAYAWAGAAISSEMQKGVEEKAGKEIMKSTSAKNLLLFMGVLAFFLILVFGIALFIVLRRRKAQEKQL